MTYLKIYQMILICLLAGISINGHTDTLAASHGPIGVMGDHTHHKGEWMLSYRFMHMDMDGTRIGDDEVNEATIVTTVANRFFGAPGQPPTLRIVPTDMTMDMHMFGGMYAPTDWLTLMVMGMYIEKDMNHVTYMGGMGTTELGRFNVNTSGLGDTTISGLITVWEEGNNKIHLNAGLSLPTGDNEEQHQILTPMGGTPTVRVPYAMQLGSGTYDLKPGITYSGKDGAWGWGGQYMGTIRTGDDNGYSLGDEHALTFYASYQWQPWISGSMRWEYKTIDSIDGIDPMIAGPVQTADPNNYGGEITNLGFGINLSGQEGMVKGHRLALEALIPISRDLNGPQMETDWTLTLGWQYAY